MKTCNAWIVDAAAELELFKSFDATFNDLFAGVDAAKRPLCRSFVEGQSLSIEVDVPGVLLGNVSVEAASQSLTIKSTRQGISGITDVKVGVADGYDPYGATASLANGVLTIHVPACNHPAFKKITVTAG